MKNEQGRKVKKRQTSENMPKFPLNVMKIPCNKLLCRWLLSEILKEETSELPGYIIQQLIILLEYEKHTRGGNTFSAARRGTENPP